jgi:hypothetical protein
MSYGIGVARASSGWIGSDQIRLARQQHAWCMLCGPSAAAHWRTQLRSGHGPVQRSACTAGASSPQPGPCKAAEVPALHPRHSPAGGVLVQSGGEARRCVVHVHQRPFAGRRLLVQRWRHYHHVGHVRLLGCRQHMQGAAMVCVLIICCGSSHCGIPSLCRRGIS